MEAKLVCVYAKFGRCKKEECEFHHPEDTCCDKTCDIHNCLKKHPRHCRYFWGFDTCRNKESCKFFHKKEDTNIVDVDKYKALEEKYNDILEKYNNVVRRIESLENVNKPCTRSRSSLSRSRVDGKRKNESDNVTTVNNDKKVKHGGDNSAIKESINNDDRMETDTQTDSTKKNNFDSTSMIYLKEEAIKLKNFVQNGKTVNEGRDECKRRFQHFSLKLKQSTNGRDNRQISLFRRFGTNIQNLPNSNFKMNAMKEIDCIIGLTSNFIASDRIDKQHEIQRKELECRNEK